MQELPTDLSFDAALRDRPFYPYRYPRSQVARQFVAEVLAQVQNLEGHKRLRQRKRKAADQITFERMVSAVICDLISRWLSEPHGWLAISLSKDVLGHASRYQPPALGKTLPAILETLASPEMGFVELRKGQQGYFNEGRQTTIRAGARLVSWIAAYGISLDDLGRETTEEVIVLKRPRVDIWDDGGWLEYEDTPVTLRYRNEIRQINAWLEAADITFDPAVAPDTTVDDTDRRLRRYFNNGSFEQGGRLFGGFWQELKKRQRHEGITIEGQPVVTLDYGQMGPRVLYGMAGADPPTQDAYLIPGLDERHREGVKKVFNALLFATKPIERFPKGTRDMFPRRVGVQQVIEQINRIHPALRSFFCSGIGFTVMFNESQILVKALLNLIERKIVALPIHDALVVSRENAGEAKKVMLRAFKRHTGVAGQVATEVG